MIKNSNSIRKSFFCLAVFILTIALASCRQKVLSEDKLSHIISEIFLVDQYVKLNPEVNQMADTALVYQAIFQKYNTSLDEYTRSIKYYIGKDKAFPEIMTNAYEIIKAERMKIERAGDWNIKFNPIEYPDLQIPYALDTLFINKWWEKDMYGEIRKDSVDFFNGALITKKDSIQSKTKKELYVADPKRIVDDSDDPGEFKKEDKDELKIEQEW